MFKHLVAASALLLFGVGSAHAAGDCRAAPDYVNDHTVAPQKPRDKQLARFAQWMRLYGPDATTPFHGAAAVFGESKAAMYPLSSLKKDFGVPAEQVANFAVDGATVEEVWWMVSMASSGFEWVTSDGKDKGFVKGVDLSHVDKALLPDLGGNSLKRATDSGPYLIATQASRLVRDLRTQMAPTARVLVTEKIEPGVIADTCYAGQQVYLNADYAKLAGDESRFAYRATPRWNIPATATEPAHCGFNHSDKALFQPNGVHVLPIYYQTFLDPVVYAFFHKVDRTPPGMDTDNGRCVAAAADPRGPLPADPAKGPAPAAAAASDSAYQGPF